MEREGKHLLAGRLTSAICLLAEPLYSFVVTDRNVPVIYEKHQSKTDFNPLLYAISKNWNQYFAGNCSQELKKVSKRAIDIRNRVCHMSFDLNCYEHEMEILSKLALLIGRPDIQTKIDDLFWPKTTADASHKNGKKVNGKSDVEKNTPKISETEWLQLKEEGNKLYALQRWTEAMNCYTKAIHINSKEAILYSNRALCELHLKKFELARQDAEDAKDLDPSNIKYYRILSEALFNLELYQEAKGICDQGLEVNPRDETLSIRTRDCNAFIVQKTTDADNPRLWNKPVTMYDDVNVQRERQKASATFFNKMKNFTPKPEDVEIFASFEAFMESRIINLNLAKGFELLKGSKRSVKSEEKAVEIFEKAAKDGNAEGQYNLGVFYLKGTGGLTKDLFKARELFYKAAKQKAFHGCDKMPDLGVMLPKIMPNVGVAEAENAIGNMFRDGRGEDVNETKAFQWFLKAAEHGLPEGRNNLGYALRNGLGCKQDHVSARKWFEMAANDGIAEAQANLADLLLSGDGGEKDVPRAAALYKVAAEQGLPNALAQLQQIMRSGAVGGIGAEDTLTLVKEIASKTNDPEAYLLLGNNYYKGEGGAVKNAQLAEKYYVKAIELGNKNATLSLSNLLFDNKRNEDGFKYLLKATDLGIVEAYAKLSHCYAMGHGCKRDENECKRWFGRAKVTCSNKEKLTNNFLNNMLQQGKSVVEWEMSNGISYEGKSLTERSNRFTLANAKKYNDGFIESYVNTISQPPPSLDKSSLRKSVFSWIPELQNRADSGSISAINFFTAMRKLDCAADLIRDGRCNDGFREFRLCYRLWDQLVLHEPELFFDAATKLLDENPNNTEALYFLAVFQQDSSIQEKLQLLKRCVELSPLTADFHHLLGCVFGFAENFPSALREFNRALELEFCSDWLYSKATALHFTMRSKTTSSEKSTKDSVHDDQDPFENFLSELSNSLETIGALSSELFAEAPVLNAQDAMETIEAYEHFLKHNPPDHRKVPEALYSIGYIYAILDEREQALRICQEQKQQKIQNFACLALIPSRIRFHRKAY